MSKIGICLGGANNGKIISSSNEKFYYAAVGGDVVIYERMDLKFIKEIHQPPFTNSYVLKQPFKIYVPKDEYDKYEGALKFILSEWIEAAWEEM